VLVVGGDVADPSVQATGVVIVAYPFQLGSEHGGVVDAIEVRPVGFHMPKQGLNPRLIRRGARPPEVLGDGQQRHEFSGLS
jgi:hypothetical protein